MKKKCNGNQTVSDIGITLPSRHGYATSADPHLTSSRIHFLEVIKEEGWNSKIILSWRNDSFPITWQNSSSKNCFQKSSN